MRDPVLLIGGCGYIGAAIGAYLATRGWEVFSLDINWFPVANSAGSTHPYSNDAIDYGLVSREYLARFRDIVLLAGHSSVGMCKADPSGAIRNNIGNFVHLALRLEPHQRIIFASSASVYGKSGPVPQTEDACLPRPDNVYDATKQHLETYAALTPIPFVALRFGTVCGHSPNLRTDVVLNGMYLNAVERRVVRVANPESSRPVLGVKDLCRAIESVLLRRDATGVYNLSSFNARFSELAAVVAGQFFDASIERYDSHTAYDMAMDCSKFSDALGFEFQDTIETILSELSRHRSHRGSDRSEGGTKFLAI